MLSWRKTMTRQTSVVAVRLTVPTLISHIHHISAVSSVSLVGDLVPIAKCCHGGRRWLDKLRLLLYVPTVPTLISHIHHISAVSSVSFVVDSVPIVKCCHGGRRWLYKLRLLLYVWQYQLWLATIITSLLYPRFPSLSNIVMEEDDDSTNFGGCCTSRQYQLWLATFITSLKTVVAVRRTVPTLISHIHHISAVSSVSFVGDSVPIVKCCHGGRRLLLYVGQYQLWLTTFITSLLYPRFPSLETQFPLSNVVMEEDDDSTKFGLLLYVGQPRFWLVTFISDLLWSSELFVGQSVPFLKCCHGEGHYN